MYCQKILTLNLKSRSIAVHGLLVMGHEYRSKIAAYEGVCLSQTVQLRVTIEHPGADELIKDAKDDGWELNT